MNGDATRTALSAERTLLAWIRTGIASMAVALGVGRIVPEVANTRHQWVYIVLGAGYGLYGAACVAFGFQRERKQTAMAPEGRFAAPNTRTLTLFAAGGVTLALATVLLVIVSP